MKYQLLIFQLILIVFLTGCAVGAGGAAGGAILCKNCKGVAKVASIGGGALLGIFLGSSAGEFLDNKDKARQVKLIEDVLQNNRDNETSTTTYKKTWRNPNGQQQTGVVSQSATPLKTYQKSNQPRQSTPQNWEQYYYTQPNRNNQYANSGVWRDMEITFIVSADNAPPSTQQYYKMCKTEQGWRSIQQSHFIYDIVQVSL
jgi:surface antigen